jgi:hypothetical protein
VHRSDHYDHGAGYDDDHRTGYDDHDHQQLIDHDDDPGRGLRGRLRGLDSLL